VNFWFGHFNKRDALRRFAERELKLPPRQHDAQIVYVGDSFNDAPLFGALRLSVGVANVRAVLAQIESPPKYVTRSAEGAGFREVARAVLRTSPGTHPG
jgi:hydroxymethylpyrimidine pyrophosphatase-like HAD family hydrolase